MLFSDRRAAGRALARELLERVPTLPGERPIVLAIPRGGVPVGAEVATALGASLDVFVARKLGAPGREELGIGAVAPGGVRVLDWELIAQLRVSASYIDEVSARERVELERRLAQFRGARAPLDVAGRAVILVDDGLATGVTARVALAALAAQSPARLIFAAPVCSREGSALIASDAVTVVCAATPENFYGVGAWYEDFEQLTDADVLAVLGIW
ncbi:MAG: phosphoribosyltransferase family protein [Gemmatimonadaceae bacterium]